MSKRARLVLQVTVGFMCTRVTCPSEEDWKKLKHTLQYIFGTLDIKRVISLDTSRKMNIFVDVSHACHMDMREQMGGCINMGKRVINARSSKQTLNSKRSTETELIGGSNYLSYSLWHTYFLKK